MAPIEEKISSIASLMRNFSRSRERNDWFTYFLIHFMFILQYRFKEFTDNKLIR